MAHQDRVDLLNLQTKLLNELPNVIDIRMTYLNGIPAVAMTFTTGVSKGQTWGVRPHRFPDTGVLSSTQVAARIYDDKGNEKWTLRELQQVMFDAELCSDSTYTQ